MVMLSNLSKKFVISSLKIAANIGMSRFITCSTTCKCLDDSFLSKRDYWRRRYDWEKQTKFDWILDAESVSDHLLPILENVHQHTEEIRMNVLDIGCGTSELPLCLLEGSTVSLKMFCVDYALGALQWQKTLLSDPKAEFGDILSNYWLVMADVCKLPFKDNFFHMIIDKGTSDSLLKSKDDGKTLTIQLIQECSRLLNPQGKLVQVTDEDPDLRLPLLQSVRFEDNLKMSVSFKAIEADTNLSSHIQEYFIYVIQFHT